MIADPATVETQQGRIKGQSLSSGVRAWRGIPFASAERFSAPDAAKPWAGTREAIKAAPMCPQSFGGRRGKSPDGFSEDCLTLNVWSPPGDGAPKPVMVWIHGGAFIAGASNQYDGAALAAQGDMVVVTINYRLGVLGFVNFGEALGLPDIPSNLGLRDQIAALRWIKDNIAVFGGDPARVTLCGQSAGSMSISLLMLAPEAWPFFHGAIMQSGAVSLIHDREKSLQVARHYAELLNLNQGSLEKLRSLDVDTLLDAQESVQKLMPGGIPASPWYDSDLLPESHLAAHSAPMAAVPLIAGATKEEIRLFAMLPGPSILPSKRAVIERMLREQALDKADAILSAYPNTKVGERALASDLAFFMPTRNFAERHARSQPTWFYRFDYAHPIVGATHAIDLPFMWPMPALTGFFVRGGFLTGKRAALADRLKSSWIQFVHKGCAPDDWPRYSPPRFATKIFSLNDSIADDPNSDRRSAWGGADASPGISAPA